LKTVTRRAPAPRWRRIPPSERDPKAKAHTDEALRTTDDYDHQEMYQLSEAARQAAAKAKRLEEHNHAHAAHAEAAAVK
jgi:hypothetical protein